MAFEVVFPISTHVPIFDDYITLCMLQGRAYLWVAGFSLAFGAMFAKTYRVHQIFRRANAGIVRSKVGVIHFAIHIQCEI